VRIKNKSGEVIRTLKGKPVVALDEYLGIAGLPFKMSRQMMGGTAFWGQNQGSYKKAEEILLVTSG
jgi:hypothetical protein